MQIIADGERCLQVNWVAVATVVAFATDLVETEAQSDQFSRCPAELRYVEQFARSGAITKAEDDHDTAAVSAHLWNAMKGRRMTRSTQL
jgi:hypothetical protein